MFRVELDNDWIDIAEIKQINRSGLILFAGHDTEVRFEPHCIILDRIMSMDEVEAELLKLAMASNNLHKSLDMICVDMHLGMDMQVIIIPLIKDIESA